MPFMFRAFELPGPLLIQPRAFRDERGYFLETYKKSGFAANGIEENFVQDNHSFSIRNVIRGLHYQLPPAAQAKLVSVVKGRVWDVVVDIRRDSPHYLKWVAAELGGENHTMLFVPSGFAHGFVVLSEDAHLLYKCTSEYAPRQERGIRWDDPQINIDWPVRDPIVSERDRDLPLLKDAETF